MALSPNNVNNARLQYLCLECFGFRFERWKKAEMWPPTLLIILEPTCNVTLFSRRTIYSFMGVGVAAAVAAGGLGLCVKEIMQDSLQTLNVKR